MSIVAANQALRLPRGAKAPSPQLPRKAKRVWSHFLHQAALRFQFATSWVSRGLGLIQPRSLNPALLEHGLTLVLPGIESESIFTYGMCDGLFEGGVPGAIRVFNWGLPFPGGYLANLTRIDRNRRRAKDLAAEIVTYQKNYPGRPVHLVAQSGGAGVAVFAAEALPDGVTIDGIVLLSGALSPTYNLTRALQKTRKGILNSHSHKDIFVLKLGTRCFGTIDRRFTHAAGCSGFELPENLSAEHQKLYAEKLCQLPWREEIGHQTHNWGGHLSSGNEAYLAKHIAPWVKSG